MVAKGRGLTNLGGDVKQRGVGEDSVEVSTGKIHLEKVLFTHTSQTHKSDRRRHTYRRVEAFVSRVCCGQVTTSNARARVGSGPTCCHTSQPLNVLAASQNFWLPSRPTTVKPASCGWVRKPRLVPLGRRKEDDAGAMLDVGTGRIGDPFRAHTLGPELFEVEFPADVGGGRLDSETRRGLLFPPKNALRSGRNDLSSSWRFPQAELAPSDGAKFGSGRGGCWWIRNPERRVVSLAGDSSQPEVRPYGELGSSGL
eukprot:1194343-Prorocentrum_minimum.AAC.6